MVRRRSLFVSLFCHAPRFCFWPTSTSLPSPRQLAALSPPQARWVIRRYCAPATRRPLKMRFRMCLSESDKQWMAKMTAPGHYRQQGPIVRLEDFQVKPGAKIKKPMGGMAGLIVAVVGKKRKVFQYAIKNRWNAKAACEMYELLRKFANKHYPSHGSMRNWQLLEDGDPSLQAKCSKSTKADLHLKSLGLPSRSPDLNPLDFCLWEKICKSLRYQERTIGKETKAEFKNRLRKTINAANKNCIKNAVRGIKNRLLKCAAAGGAWFEV